MEYFDEQFRSLVVDTNISNQKWKKVAERNTEKKNHPQTMKTINLITLT